MEKSFVFNSINGDRKYKSEDFASYFASFIGDGVFPNPSTGLQVIDNNDMSVAVQAGKGWIKGYFYQNTDDFILKIDLADSLLNRIDRVVLRLDYNKRAVNLFIKKGTFASSPVAPLLQRDADIYELGLADVYVRAGVISIIQSNITDLRLDSTYCGIVHGTVDQVDVTTIFNQYTTKFKLKEEEFETEFEEWIEQLKDVLEGDVAGNLLNLINTNKDNIDKLQKTTTSQLADIATDIKNIDLSADKITLDSSNLKSKNVKGALEELFTSGNNVKSNTVDALLQVDKSLQISKNNNWDDIIDSIKKIKLGKKWAYGYINDKSQYDKWDSYRGGEFYLDFLDFKPSIIFMHNNRDSVALKAPGINYHSITDDDIRQNSEYIYYLHCGFHTIDVDWYAFE